METFSVLLPSILPIGSIVRFLPYWSSSMKTWMRTIVSQYGKKTFIDSASNIFGDRNHPFVFQHGNAPANTARRTVAAAGHIHYSIAITVFPLTHNRCEVVISWWSRLLPKISIYATKCESILEKSGIFIHLQSKHCINLNCKTNLTISWVQIAARW